jgi:N-formylglutamate amidohydrolase
MPPFDRIGAAEPASPVIVSVPHAGRDYPPALIAALRVPAAALLPLEDRYVDVVARAALGQETMLAQRPARAWIDLNRAESERDPRIDEGAATVSALAAGAKLRSGLGLVPRRAGAAGELWRRRWTDAEIVARIAADHRPYHQALAALLAAARRRFGAAVLLDVHSMPPLPGGQAPRVVIGDRFGRAASPRLVARAEAAAGKNCAVGINTPYAGAHVLARHGAPRDGVHAIQFEIDRSLYLDPALDRPDPIGVAWTAALLRRVIDALAQEAMAIGQSTDDALAAE